METLILDYFQKISSPFLDKFFVSVTMIGEELFYIAIIGVIYWCFDKKFAMGIGLAVLFSSLVNSSIKELVGAKRPFEVLDIRALRKETATGSSFPSGHTQVVATFFSYLSCHKKKWIAIGVPITVLVAISRLYLGVHWGRDVIFAILIGMFLAGLIFLITKRDKHTILAGLLILVSVVLLFYFKSSNLQKSAGALIGLGLGSIVEHHFIHFDICRTVMEAVFRILMGVLMTVAAYISTSYLIGGMPALKYGIIVFVMTAVVPLAFRKEIHRYY